MVAGVAIGFILAWAAEIVWVSLIGEVVMVTEVTIGVMLACQATITPIPTPSTMGASHRRSVAA